MKKINEINEKIYLAAIVILSALLNFVNLGIEGTSNAYYAAGVKSMTINLKNFFFVSMDPAGFVTIDKPPFGFWMQAISAKIFGFSGVSILLPQALAGVFSTVVIFIVVKKSFGSTAGLLSALFLAVTPVFVAVSRNNTIDNQLVFVLLLACWALTTAARNGKFKYLVLGMVLIGVGFNIKALEAYMILPAVYIMYLLSNTISIKKRITYLSVGTVILLAVSFSWALIVDSIPKANRPYVGSSGNNTEMGLIIGHNGSERVSLGSLFGSSNSQQGGGPGGFGQGGQRVPSGNALNGGFRGGAMGGGFGGSNGLSGTFGAQTPAGITRLFSKNILSDQIVWFIPLAFFGFFAAVIKEKLKIKLDNDRKQSIVMWFMWFFPEFVYFSFNTGLFHPHYLTMMSAPIAALTGIGLVYMWQMYKDGGLKAWLLPVSLLTNGIVHMVMLSYFKDSSDIVKILVVLLIALCFIPALILTAMNIFKKGSQKVTKVLATLGVIGILVSPLAGSSAVMFYAVNSTNPSAGMELLPATLSANQNQNGNTNSDMGMRGGFGFGGNSINTTDLVNFLNNHKVNGESQIVVSSSNTSENLTINTDLYVGSLSGFQGNETIMSLEQFKSLVKNGEVRYVLANEGNGRNNSGSEIMNWVKENGKLVSYGSTDSSSNENGNTEQLYDLEGTVK